MQRKKEMIDTQITIIEGKLYQNCKSQEALQDESERLKQTLNELYHHRADQQAIPDEFARARSAAMQDVELKARMVQCKQRAVDINQPAQFYQNNFVLGFTTLDRPLEFYQRQLSEAKSHLGSIDKAIVDAHKSWEQKSEEQNQFKM